MCHFYLKVYYLKLENIFHFLWNNVYLEIIIGIWQNILLKRGILCFYVDFTTNILLLTQSLFSITKTGTHSFDHCNFVDTRYPLWCKSKNYPKIIKTFCILRNWNRFNAPIKVIFCLEMAKLVLRKKF